jgi:Flp pilus assembly protein TadG
MVRHFLSCRARRGIALLLSAVLLAVLVGFVGMAVDLGFWANSRAQLQTAADLAVLSAGQDLRAGHPREFIEESARAAVVLNGGQARELVAVEILPDRVAVELRREAPGFFSRIYGQDHLLLRARASARVEGGRVALAE